MKEWTVLVYACGNNEMEPELWQAKRELEQACNSNRMQVVLQLGRMEQYLSRLLRPMEVIPAAEEKWVGVRRYFMTCGKSQLLADPQTLYQFIYWGMNNYPARRTVLVISGHGTSFAGALTDYSQQLPYIMGIPELCRAIQCAASECGQINLLVLDMCYMNYLEVIYELAYEVEPVAGHPPDPTPVHLAHTITPLSDPNRRRPLPGNWALNRHHITPLLGQLLTYIGIAPFKGLSYGPLLQILQQAEHQQSVNVICRMLIDNLPQDLIAVQLDPFQLSRFKEQVSSLAYSYLSGRSGSSLSCLPNTTPTAVALLSTPEGEALLESIDSLVTYHRVGSGREGHLLQIMCEDLENLAPLYARLSFAQNNYWFQLLGGENPVSNGKTTPRMQPLALTRFGLLGFIMSVNPGLDMAGATKLLQQLIEYRQWSWK